MKTQDGWIMIAPYTDARWVKAFEVLGASKELDDERLNDRRKRFFNSDLMHERIGTYFLAQTTDHWVQVLSDANIPASKANSLEDLRQDPHLQQTGFFQKREHPTEGAYWEIQPPVRFPASPQKEIRPAPHIGQDTDDVLAELGLAPSQQNPNE